MTLFRAQIVLPMFTNLPRDVITNTLWFRDDITPSTTQEAADGLGPLIQTFYISAYANGGLASYVLASQAYVNFYNMSDPEPRVPVRHDINLATASGVSDIPTEVSCVLSFQGDPESGVPAGRRRGRIYLGGLGSAFMSAGAPNAYPIIATVVRNAIGVAATTFRAAVNGTDDFTWVVNSTTAGETFDVTHGWVDDSPDTQRRRSVESNLRTLWPA